MTYNVLVIIAFVATSNAVWFGFVHEVCVMFVCVYVHPLGY